MELDRLSSLFKLTIVARNLERTLKCIDGLLGHHDLVAKERSLIEDGPNADDLKPYYDAIDRLLSASQALAQTDVNGQGESLAGLNALIKVGGDRLVQLFGEIVKESSVAVDAGALFSQGKTFPVLSASFQDRGMALYDHLRNLPSIGDGLQQDLEAEYADVRAKYFQDSIKSTAKVVLVDALAIGGKTERRGLARLLDVLLAFAKSEHALLISLFPNSATMRSRIYSGILPPSLNTFFTTGQQLNTLVKQELSTLVLIAFSSYAELTERTPEFEEWIRSKGGRKDNELGELLHAFRGSCLRSLPEFISDAQAFGTKAATAAEASSVGVSSTTRNILSFIRHLADNSVNVEAFLKVLGAGNWGTVADSLPTMEFEESSSLLSRYLNDLLTALLTSLDTRSRALRPRPGYAQFFLLNNISYARREVFSTSIGDLLSDAVQDLLNKRMRSTKVSYLELWSPIVSSLLDSGLEHSGAAGALKAAIAKGGGEKRGTKDRFVRFGDAFEEIEILHKAVKWDGDDELREKLKIEVNRMIVPTYSKFYMAKASDFSNTSEKHLKLDPDQLMTRLNALFE